VKRRSLAALVVLGAALGSGCATGFTTQPTYLTDTSATLNGFVLSTQGTPTDYWAEWGETTAYGEQSSARRAAGSPTFVSIPIANLGPDTLYHYRLCARDAEAATCSHDATFTTRPPGGRSGIAFFSVRDRPAIHLMNIDGSGQTRISAATHSFAIFPSWSPDATRIAFTSYIGGTNFDVFAMDAGGGNEVNLTDDPASDGDPAWSPDGTRIAFSSDRTGNHEIYVMDADGANPTPLTNNMEPDNAPAWSPDGRKIAYETGHDIWTMNADGTNRINLTTSAAFEEAPSWSPDGTRIAFASNAGAEGDREVFVMPSHGGAATNLTNFSEGFAVDGQPSWSPDGSRIAFMSNRVPVDNAEIFVMDADGENPANLTRYSGTDEFPAWSPRP
jgi:Tol biopolymer transport system component